MKKEIIKKSIEVNSPKKSFPDDKYTRIWYSEFSEGSYAETTCLSSVTIAGKD